MKSMNPPEELFKGGLSSVAKAVVVGPLALPFLPVVAGLAVAGLGMFAASSIIGQVADSVMRKGEPEENIGERRPFGD